MKKCIFLLLVCLGIFLSCKSKPAFDGRGDLCGLVVDENNFPIKDFVIYCKATDIKSWGAKPVITPVLTNESGLFVFYGLPSGEYCLSGEKNNYLKLDSALYSFNDRTKIVCFQTKSLKAAVLNAEELLRLRQADQAAALLQGICFESGSPEESFFKEYIAKLEEVSK